MRDTVSILRFHKALSGSCEYQIYSSFTAISTLVMRTMLVSLPSSLPDVYMSCWEAYFEHV